MVGRSLKADMVQARRMGWGGGVDQSATDDVELSFPPPNISPDLALFALHFPLAAVMVSRFDDHRDHVPATFWYCGACDLT